MLTKFRQLLSIYKSSLKNFFPSLKNGTRNIIKDFPNQLNNFKTRIFTFKTGLTILCLIILIFFPFFPETEYYVSILMYAMIFAILAASWDFLTGFIGQVSFGHAIFFGISAYTGALLIENFGFSWFHSVFLGAMVAVLMGLFIGIPSLRLRGPYLALGTQAFALIMFNLMLSQEELVISQSFTEINYVTQYFILMAFMIISLTIMLIIVKSKMGTIFRSIRDDQICADASGINTTKYKLIGFMISSFFAGISGTLYMAKVSSVSYGNFLPLYSFYAIIMAAIGGLGTITGAAIGSYTFFIIQEIFSEIFSAAEQLEAFASYGPVLVFSLFLILVIRFAEQGIMKPVVERLKELFDVLMGR
ncbi:MAG: branched-chain amino acid ABC transporter permease [Promethearchaeota archaeon]